MQKDSSTSTGSRTSPSDYLCPRAPTSSQSHRRLGFCKWYTGTLITNGIILVILPSTYACSCECKLCTSSFRLSTIATSSASRSPSRSRCASDFLQSSTDKAARSSLFNNSYFRSRLFSCSLQGGGERETNSITINVTGSGAFLPTYRMFSCICLRINAFFLLTSVNHWANSCSSDSSASVTRQVISFIHS